MKTPGLGRHHDAARLAEDASRETNEAHLVTPDAAEPRTAHDLFISPADATGKGAPRSVEDEAAASARIETPALDPAPSVPGAGVYLAPQSDGLPPPGVPAQGFPDIDGSDRAQVFSFLKTLGFSPAAGEEEHVWRIWQAAWAGKARAADFFVDLDRTLYDYSFTRFEKGFARKFLASLGLAGGLARRGDVEEEVRVREILISLAAKALRDRSAVPFVSHSATMRVADMAADKNLSILKFVLFLRMPGDPDVTEAEIGEMPTAMTYEKLGLSEAGILEKYAAAGMSLEALNPDERLVVARAMADFSAYGYNFVRAHKDMAVIRGLGGKFAGRQIDDSRGNVVAGASSGGEAVFAPKDLSGDPDPLAAENSYALNVGRAFEALDDEPPGAVIDIRHSQSTVSGLPRATVRYGKFLSRSVSGWVRASASLALVKVRLWAAIARRGDFLETLGSFRKLIEDAEWQVRFRRLKGRHPYRRGSLARDFYAAAQPTPEMNHLAPLHDYVRARETAEGKLLITAKSRPEGAAPAEEQCARADYYRMLPGLAREAIRALKKFGEDAFDDVAALWGARAIDRLGLAVEVEGLENLDPNKTYIFAPTHGSEVEFPILNLLFKGHNAGFIAKRLMRWVPFFGSVMSRSPRFFFIDRSNTDSAMATLGRAVEVLKMPGNRHSIIIYPQGTRSRAILDKDGERIDGDLYARGGLKSGVAHLALETGVEIVPVTFNNVGRVMPAGTAAPIVNENVRVTVGKPIDPKSFSGTRRDQVDAILDVLYDFYDATYEAPHASKQTAKAREALNRIKKAKGRAVHPDVIAKILAEASPVSATLGLDAKETQQAVKEGKVNVFRAALNDYLDGFHAEILARFAAPGRAGGAKVADETREMLDALPEEELLGVLSRAGYDLTTPLAMFDDPDAAETWQYMRTQRTGLWLLRNIAGRVLKRFATLFRAPEIGVPEVRYHDASAGGMPAFDELRERYAAKMEPDARAAAELLEGQISIQSENFRSAEWPRLLNGISDASLPLEAAARRHVEAARQAPENDFTPVSEARYALHRSVFANPALAGVDANARLFAFESLLAREEWRQAMVAGDAAALERARGRVFRLWGRAAAHQARNAVNKSLAEGGSHGEIAGTAALAERIEMASEMAARGDSPVQRLAEVEKELAAVSARLGVLKWKRFNPLSVTAIRYRELCDEKRHLEILIASDPPWEASDPTAFLLALAGKYAPFDPAAKTLDDVLKSSATTDAAWQSYQDARAAWEKAETEKTAAVLPHELDLYQATFEEELARNRADFSFQVARYEDLMRQIRSGTSGLETVAVVKDPQLTYGLEFETRDAGAEIDARFNQALADYKLRFAQYEKVAEEMTRPGAKSSEPQRKKHELDGVFFAWLRLQFCAADAAKRLGSGLAGKIRPVSAMFPNQTRLLNALASNQMEGLRPILESITLEQTIALYSEIHRRGNDPRRLALLMAKWGLDSTKLGAGPVNVYGAKALVGALGQSAGIGLYEAGLSLLKPDQARDFGSAPFAMAFSPNHQGFFDYPFAAAFLQALGLGDVGIVYEKDNFYSMPILGDFLRNGSGIPTERGKTRLSDVIPRYVDRGISPLTYDHGTRRATTARNPLASGPYAAFWPRESIFGGSRAESANAAALSGIPEVPVFQDVKINVEPDLGLSGNKFKGNFLVPWSIHNGAGGLLKREATMALGAPFSPGKVAQAGTGLPGSGSLAGLTDAQRRRRVLAAHTEVGRFNAFLGTLAPMPKPVPMPLPV